MILLARFAAASALAPSVVVRAAKPGAKAPGLAGSASQPASMLTLPAAIRDALAGSAAAVDPITLRWTTRSRSATELEQLAGAINAQAREHDRMINEHRHYRVTFQGGKYRASHQDEPRERLEVTPLNESAFDGAFLYGGTIQPPYDGLVQTSYLKYPLAGQGPETGENRYVSSDVLDAMGVRLPVRIRDMKSKSPVRSEILYMLEQEGARLVGVDDVELDGRKLVRLRILADDPERAMAEGVALDTVRRELARATTQAEIDRVIDEIKQKRQLPPKRLFVFHLDPPLNFAIRRCEEFWEPDVPLTRTDLTGHEKLADDRDVFVPRTIVTENYSRKPLPPGQTAKAVQTRTTEITQASGDAKPDATFALAYDTPGTHVYVNDEKGKQTGYVVQEDGTLIDERRWRPGRKSTTR